MASFSANKYYETEEPLYELVLDTGNIVVFKTGNVDKKTGRVEVISLHRIQHDTVQQGRTRKVLPKYLRPVSDKWIPRTEKVI